MSDVTFDVVIPTIGRPSLRTLLDGLCAASGPRPGTIYVAHDRVGASPLSELIPPGLHELVTVVPGPGRGPAAARNAGWRHSDADWIAFLDDDVEIAADWYEALAADLSGLDAAVAGSQGRLHVPLPTDRAPTDWERNVAGLEHARWATADLAYRRTALEAAGGFDERFPRAYREDADLGLRLTRAGWRIVRGARTTRHPVRPADRWVSVQLQRGNADDPLTRFLHGRHWRRDAGVPQGRRPRHLITTAAAVTALGAAVARRRTLATVATATWLTAIAEFAAARIAPGPREAGEVATMIATSAAIPAAATWHWLRGWARTLLRRPQPIATRGPAGPPDAFAVQAVLFDRDGTLVVDEPYNGDPAKVRLMPGARAAVDRVRAAGLPVAVVTNQSGIGRGLITPAQVAAVNRRVEQLLGPIDEWVMCPHAPDDGCDCRKPRPGMVLQAAASLGVVPSRCAFIGDIGDDVSAALAAGARPVLVPTEITLPEEIAAAPEVAPDLPSAIDRVLGGRP